ncbi:hypothetical protein CRUP_007249 [Coryphaenoides rupestris]|nr:hypothetical protein CRUP_007249 [Coryphaenoides rupestris]
MVAALSDPRAVSGGAPAPAALCEAEVKCHSQSTLRFVLTLFQSDERAFPEFSYTDLVGKQSDSMVIKDGAQNTCEEHDIQDHVELAAIARQFEKKYGEVKKKKKDRIQDLVDIGYGYDDEDSFIDNSEAMQVEVEGLDWPIRCSV